MVPSFEIPDTARLVVVALLDVELMIERLVSVLLAELTRPAFNVCTAVHVFAFPKLSDATTLPVVGEMVSVLSELVTELTLPGFWLCRIVVLFGHEGRIRRLEGLVKGHASNQSPL